MTGTNSRPMIVAVFGGSRNDVREGVLKLAQCAGSKISEAGFIILTGGKLTERVPPKAVKDAALLGAAPAVRWIGVLRGGDRPGFKQDGKGGVIFSSMGHQRNFLEASLCDAAIVLKGKKGTISEAVSTICLGKPVLLVGTSWPEVCPALHQLFETGALTLGLARDLIDAADIRLGNGTRNGPMRDLIKQALEPSNIRRHERSRLISADDLQACPAIADWLTQIRALPQKGEFPPLGELYNPVRDGYRRWLESLFRSGP